MTTVNKELNPEINNLILNENRSFIYNKKQTINEKKRKNIFEQKELASNEGADSVSDLINNIQNLINKSKLKIENDLFKIEKKEMEESMLNKVGVIKKNKIRKKSKTKILENKNEIENNISIRKRRINKNRLNERYTATALV